MMEQQPSEPTTPQTPAVSQPKFDYHPSPEESELIRLSKEWMDVVLSDKDEKRLREIMSPAFTLQIWDASRAPQPFEAWLDLGKHSLDITHFEYSSLNAQVFGDFGVVYSQFWWNGTMHGKPFTDSGFMADIWIKKQGQWQVISRRSAPQQQIQALREVGTT
jgi:hypothetical protein